MAKVTILELPIFTYSCTSHPDRMCLATIGNLPLLFKGKTPMQAHMAAEKWRKEEHARLSKGDARKKAAAT